MCRTACTESQCLYKGALYLHLYLLLAELVKDGTSELKLNRDLQLI